MEIRKITSNTPVAFNGCSITKNTAKYILDNVHAAEDWEIIHKAIPKLENCELRDFNFRIKKNADGDAYLSCKMDEYYVMDRLEKPRLLSSINMSESDELSITDMFKHCESAVDVAETKEYELANKFARKYYL